MFVEAFSTIELATLPAVVPAPYIVATTLGAVVNVAAKVTVLDLCEATAILPQAKQILLLKLMTIHISSKIN